MVLGFGWGTVLGLFQESPMIRKFVDLGDLRQRSPLERVSAEGDTHKLVVLPGFEVWFQVQVST